MITFIASGRSVRDGVTPIYFYRHGSYQYSVSPNSRSTEMGQEGFRLHFESSYEDALEKFQKLVGEITFAEAS